MPYVLLLFFVIKATGTLLSDSVKIFRCEIIHIDVKADRIKKYRKGTRPVSLVLFIKYLLFVGVYLFDEVVRKTHLLIKISLPLVLSKVCSIHKL